MKIKVALFLMLSVLTANGLMCQKISKKIIISGNVTDAASDPVIGAMIFVDTKNTGIVTDSKGFYKVRVKPDAERITIFTCTSGSAEELIKGRTIINFVLEGSSRDMNNSRNTNSGNEPVNIGYGASKEKDLTMPVNRIDAKGTDYSAYSDIYDMLTGTVPGVQVSGKKIVIRGVATNSSNTDPLFIVNGVTVQSIETIHPSMVESIQVLKGASASIYGVQGANGVIMITTKSGRSEK